MRRFFRAVSMVKAVRELHRPKRVRRSQLVCKADGQDWPCKTARIVLD